MSDLYEWDGDWGAISENEARQLEEELQKELSPAHVLFGTAVIARGRRRDVVLFSLPDGKVATVHLTWRLEADPSWPWTEIYSSFEDWKAVPFEDR